MPKYILILLVFCSGCNNSQTYTLDSAVDSMNSAPKVKTAEELREELRIAEINSPSKYLTVKNVLYRRNFFDEFVVEGVITNKATMAVYKDIVIEIEYLAPSGTVISSKQFTRYDVLAPGYDITFKYKHFVPDAATVPRVTVVHADPHE